MSATWVLRDDDDQNGVTYVSAWWYVRNEKKAITGVEAQWTPHVLDAHRFTNQDVARLVSFHVGGKPKQLRLVHAFANNPEGWHAKAATEGKGR